MKTLHKIRVRIVACVIVALMALSLWAAGGTGTWNGAFANETAPAEVTGIYSRPETSGWVNFAIETEIASYGNQTGLTDDSWYAKTFANSMLINGKRVSAWPAGQIDVHLNMDWASALKKLDGTAFGAEDKAPDTSKNIYYFGFNKINLNFSGDGYDVFTVLPSFPADSPANYRAAEQMMDGGDPNRNNVLPTNQGLDREINLRVVPQEDGSFTFELLPEGTRILKSKEQAMFTEEALQAEGTNFVNGEIVDVTYEGNTDADSLTFKTNENGEFAISLDPEYAIDMTGDGWNALDPNTSVGAQRGIEFWVYSPVLHNDADLLAGGGAIEVSNGGTPDAPNEYQWFMSDIFANAEFKQGVWNHFIFKFREPSNGGDGATTDEAVFEGMNWFRFYLTLTSTELPENTKNSIYFSNIRLVQTPAQSAQVIETARVMQYLDPSVAQSPAIGGEAVKIDANITTGLLNTPGQEASAVSYSIVGGDTDSFVIEDDSIRATAQGTVTVRATLAGDDRYAPATAEFTVSSRKAEQDALTISSDAEGTYGAAYTLSVTGGSTQGAVTYEVVSGPATVEGDALTFTAAGTVVVRATMAGDNDYEPVTSEPFTITVAKASITVKVTDRQILVNTSLPTAYSYEIVSGTLLSGDVISLTYSTDADITKPGTYDITAVAGSSDKYEITVQKGTLTITGDDDEGTLPGGDDEGTTPGGDEAGGCSSSVAWSGSMLAVSVLGFMAVLLVRLRRKSSK